MPLTFAILRPSELQQGRYLLESDNATRCRTKWSSAFLGALASHPRKVLSLHNASHLFVDLETRFELSPPIFTHPRLGYDQTVAGVCDSWNVQPALDASERSLRYLVSFARQARKRLVLFPPVLAELADQISTRWFHLERHVTRALTAGAEIGMYRQGLDVSFPPASLHLQRIEHVQALAVAAAAASSCAARRYFVSFDGTAIRLQNMRDPIGKDFVGRYRERLTSLDDPAHGVHVAVCRLGSKAGGGNDARQRRRGVPAAAAAAAGTDVAAGGGAAAAAAAGAAGAHGRGLGLQGVSITGCDTTPPKPLTELLNASFVLVPRGDMPYAYRVSCRPPALPPTPRTPLLSDGPTFHEPCSIRLIPPHVSLHAAHRGPRLWCYSRHSER